MPDEPIKKILPFIFLIVLLLAVIFVNFIYQLINKPAELFGLFTSGSYKTTLETWDVYGKYFRKHATKVITPEFLCALAQVESGGNQFATPHWRWRWTTNVTRIYAPASTAVGLMQYTDGTFEEATRFCIHDHKVCLEGRWFEPDTCWFNFFYTRLSASNSIEITSARLDYYINRILKKYGKTNISIKKKQQLGAVIHLCGESKGRKFVKNNFNPNAVSPCGSHNPSVYIGRIEIIMDSLKRHIDVSIQE